MNKSDLWALLDVEGTMLIGKITGDSPADVEIVSTIVAMGDFPKMVAKMRELTDEAKYVKS